MVGKYFDGVLPEATAYGPAEAALQSLLAETVATADDAMLRLDFASGIGAVKSFVDAVNLYVTEQAPWVLAKDPADAARLATVLYTICESLRAIAVLHHAVMPKATQSIWEQLGAEPGLGPLASQDVLQAARWGQLPVGSQVTKGANLFPRLEESAS
jgi:methionyl-tRNA synthetase